MCLRRISFVRAAVKELCRPEAPLQPAKLSGRMVLYLPPEPVLSAEPIRADQPVPTPDK
jgi:hypothetical protein